MPMAEQQKAILFIHVINNFKSHCCCCWFFRNCRTFSVALAFCLIVTIDECPKSIRERLCVCDRVFCCHQFYLNHFSAPNAKLSAHNLPSQNCHFPYKFLQCRTRRNGCLFFSREINVVKVQLKMIQFR
jgi:hypothetical protein